MARTVTSALGSVTSTGTAVRTFAAVPIGAAAADRIVAVPIDFERGTCSGVTIGGVAASLVTNPTNSPLANSAIAWAAVPDGTTADIVATFSQNPSFIALAAHRLTGMTATAYDTATANQTNNSDLTVLIDMIAGGHTLTAGYNRSNGGAAPTYTGVTSVSAVNLGGRTGAVGANDSPSTAANATVRTVYTTAASTSLTAVSFQPTAAGSPGNASGTLPGASSAAASGSAKGAGAAAGAASSASGSPAAGSASGAATAQGNGAAASATEPGGSATGGATALGNLATAVASAGGGASTGAGQATGSAPGATALPASGSANGGASIPGEATGSLASLGTAPLATGGGSGAGHAQGQLADTTAQPQAGGASGRGSAGGQPGSIAASTTLTFGAAIRRPTIRRARGTAQVRTAERSRSTRMPALSRGSR